MEGLQQAILDAVEQRAHYSNVSKRYIVLKRLFDVTVSSFGILLLFPVLAVTAAAIKLDSNGPVLQPHVRMGLLGRYFKLYRFRTSVYLSKELENSNPKDLSNTDCQKLTRVGKFIERWNFAGLPQLFNILKGDMSFVGPRPYKILQLLGNSEWYVLRYWVRPGLTGLWNIASQTEISPEDIVRLDLKYIRERSFRYDFKILCRTLIKPISRFQYSSRGE